MKIATARMITAALSGQLDNVKFELDPVFNIEVPTSCPDVPAEVLMPKNRGRQGRVRHAGEEARAMFVENFSAFEATAKPEVKTAGPKA